MFPILRISLILILAFCAFNAAAEDGCQNVPVYPALADDGSYTPWGDAASRYKGSYYEDINQALRGKIPMDMEVRGYIARLDELVMSDSNVPGKYWRVENLRDGRLQPVRYDPAYTSISQNQQWAIDLVSGADKPKILYEIDAPYGVGGLRLDDYLPGGNLFEIEQETLLPRGSYIPVTGVRPAPFGQPGSLIADARYVPPGMPGPRFRMPNDSGIDLTKLKCPPAGSRMPRSGNLAGVGYNLGGAAVAAGTAGAIEYFAPNSAGAESLRISAAAQQNELDIASGVKKKPNGEDYPWWRRMIANINFNTWYFPPGY